MASKTRDQATDEVNADFTSMIDVTFLLLIFFMCSIKFKVLEGKLQTYLPKDVGVNTTPQQEMLETIDSAGQAVFEGLSRTQKEISDFIAERIRQDLGTHQAMLRCRSFGELREVQAHYLRTAVDQYGVGASRLLDIGRDVAARSMERAAD